MRNTFAGVDVGGTRIKIGIADSTGQLFSSRVLETRECQDVKGFLDTIAAEISSQSRVASHVVAAAGLGCPGRIDFASGRVAWLRSKLEFLEGVPLAALLGERLGCPVVCDNDVNTILAGEMRFGAGRGCRDVAAVTVGTGIGGALVLGGNMVRGTNWATGHFGYMSHDPWGVRHVCGNTGIVEEHASQSGILRQLRKALEVGEVSPLTQSLARGEEPGLREVFDAAEAGDSLGRRLADRLTCEFGVLIANLIYAIDPELVLVGGGLITHRPKVLDAIRNEVAARVEYLPPGATKILPMALGDAAGVLGGVALAMDAVPQINAGLHIQGEDR
ncbi:MAG TPA: ROK family protein [Candidatus Limnocylindrales bacterium]|nr:ROK family protein [Candidatus Limnocylindrales bacterium]